MGKARSLFIAKNVLCSAFQVLESYLIYYTTPSLRLRVCVSVCVGDKYSPGKFITEQIEPEATSEPAAAAATVPRLGVRCANYRFAI